MHSACPIGHHHPYCSPQTRYLHGDRPLYEELLLRFDTEVLREQAEFIRPSLRA